MENSPISWLEYSDKTLEQAIEEWIIDKNTRKLTAWLVMSNRDVGNIECITPEKMHSFVQGVLKLDENIAAAYHLPMQWPPESIESTQVLRDIMLLVPAWKNEVNADQSRSEELGIKQLLYPLQEHKQILASNSYPPGTEAFRMHLGMQPNDAWWRKLPLWSKEEKGVHATSNTWEHLMKKVLAHPHPEQGTRLALISSALEVLKKNDDHNSGGSTAFFAPTVKQVMASNVEGKMALALWQALNCPRNSIPDPIWWNAWDMWCHDDQPRAELALATLLLARTSVFEIDNQDNMLRQTLVRLASLREPPINFSIVSMNTERKKYANWSLDDLIGKALPVETRTLRFFEGLTNFREQLILHYQALQEKPLPRLGLPDAVLNDFLVS